MSLHSSIKKIVVSYSQSISGSSFVNYELKFTGDQSASQIEDNFYRILERDLPKLQFGSDLGYRIGDLVLFYGTAGDLTRVAMTYDLLNLTYSAALQDSTSAEFIQHSSVFCTDVSSMCSYCYCQTFFRSEQTV